MTQPLTDTTMTYDWQISRLDCLPTAPEGTDYVVTAHWRLVGTDGTFSGSVYSTCGFPVVAGEAFIPYADLTLDTVLDWCFANGVDKDSAEAAVAKQIADQIDPPIVSPALPWA
jgi:hypothetical protein